MNSSGLQANPPPVAYFAVHWETRRNVEFQHTAERSSQAAFSVVGES
jgi:hypothetical protein